jgi:hypothetical protein
MNSLISTSDRMAKCLVVVIGALGCTRSQHSPPDPMHTISCDTRPMKPIGRTAQVPEAALAAGFATVAGVVVQRETGDAIQSASVRLMADAGSTGHSKPERHTDSKGGFTFDSVIPGRYQVRVRHINEYQDSASILAVAGRLDTVRVAMRAFRCYGY